MSEDSEKVRIRREQAEHDKKSVRSIFLEKKRREEKTKIQFGNEVIEIKALALSDPQIRKIRDQHPPRKGDVGDSNLGFNAKTFPAHFMSETYIEPELSREEWQGLWDSEDWSAGEIQALFDWAWGVSMKGFNVPFGDNS